MRIVRVEVDPDLPILMGEIEARLAVRHHLYRLHEYRRKQGLPTALHVATLRNHSEFHP